jgi:hypothetical protein
MSLLRLFPLLPILMLLSGYAKVYYDTLIKHMKLSIERSNACIRNMQAG